jgi:hypothetical protein
MAPTSHRARALLYAAALAAALQPPSQPSRAAQAGEVAARHVIVCVDGVGFSTIEKMRAEGRFRSFGAPARMISPFPSLTNVAMVGIMGPIGVGETAGYEDNYFDVDENRFRGGLLDRFRGGRFIRGTFRERFDYHPSAIKSGLGYALPPVSTYLEALSDLSGFRRELRRSDGPLFLAYVGGTDSLAHLGGEGMLRSVLGRLDEAVADILRDGRGNVTVTVFSDHGNHFRKYRRADVKRAIRRAGLRLDGRLRDGRSVVLPQFGLVGAATLYTAEENEARLAAYAARSRGVEFAAYERDGVVHVIARDGRAAIERRGDRYRYRALVGDPLELGAALRDLEERGALDGDGFVADSDWFAATSGGDRPDAVRRVYEGLTDHVENRANVVLSLEDGYLTGSAALDVFAVMRATHGNLNREQSLGFVMSTGRDLPAYLRAEDVWDGIQGTGDRGQRSVSNRQ